MKLRQPEMAELLNVSPRTYQSLEYGHKEIDKDITESVRNLIKQRNIDYAFNAKPIVKNGIGLGEAVDLILNNIEEAEKIPSFAMYIKTVFQEGEKSANLTHLNRLLKLKEND